jgi:hypothetical protein
MLSRLATRKTYRAFNSAIRYWEIIADKLSAAGRPPLPFQRTAGFNSSYERATSRSLIRINPETRQIKELAYGYYWQGGPASSKKVPLSENQPWIPTEGAP